MGKFKDLTGQIFGRLTVVNRAEDKILPSGQKKVMWHCICECGNESDVEAGNLINGLSKSCGCLPKGIPMDLTRRVFDNNGKLIQKVCSCCKELLDISCFTQSKHRPDGFKEYCNDCLKYDVKKRYSHYKSGAKSRNLCFEITLDDFQEITSKPCMYCGEFTTYFNGKWINGMDRVDSSQGYTLDNTVPCCEMCNRMKLHYNIDEWLNKIKKFQCV